MRLNKKITHKIISIILVITFFTSDMAFSNPGISSRQDTLQVPTPFQSVSASRRMFLEGELVALRARGIDLSAQTENLVLITPGNERLILAYEKSRSENDRLFVPVFVADHSDDRSFGRPLCEVVICPDKDPYIIWMKGSLIRTTPVSEPDLPPSVRFYKTPIDRLPGGGRERSVPSGEISVPLPADVLKQIKKEPSSTGLILNGAYRTISRVKEEGAIKNRGIRTDYMEAAELAYTRAHITYEQAGVIRDGEAFIKGFRKEYPDVSRLMLIMDEKRYNDRDNDPVAPLLYLVPHKFYSVDLDDPNKAGNKRSRRIYIFLVETADLVGFKEHRVLHYLWENRPVKAPGKAVYTDAVIGEGRLLSGTLVPSVTTKYIPPAIYKEHAHVVLDNCEVSEGGHFAVNKDETIFQTRIDLVGKKMIAVVDHGRPYSVIGEDGSELYHMPDEDSENAVFTDHTLKNGKFVSGKFYNAFPSRMYVEQVPEDCIVNNVRCDKNGGLFKFNQMFWKQRRGYENYSGILMVRKRKKVIQIFDKEGKLLWFDPNEIQGFDMRCIHLGASYSDGEIKGGEIIFAAETGIPFKELQKYPDCILSNLNTDGSGKLSVGDRDVFTIKRLPYATGLAAIREKSRITKVYDKNGALVFSNTPQARNAVYSYSYLKDGKFHWSGFYRALPGQVPSEIPKLMPNCAVANVEVNENNGVSLAHAPPFVQNMPSIHGRKDIVCIFHNSEPLAICGPDGTILRTVNDKALARIELEQKHEALNPRAAVEIIRTFGLVNAFTIISRAFNISTPLAREIVFSYFESLDKKDQEEARANTKRKKNLKEFCAATRRIFRYIDLKPSDAQWLSLVLMDSMYRFMGEDSGFRVKLEEETANSANPYCLKLAYKEVLKKYKKIRLSTVAGGLKKELFLFQKAAIDFIAEHKRVLLADESGLGKTYTSIASALSCKEGGAEKVLVVSPKSAVKWWGTEIVDSTDIPRENVYVHGSKNNPDIEDSRFVVVNYEAIRKPRSALRKKLLNAGFDFIIVDEAHRMRNDKTLQAEAIMEFDAEYKLLVSATPLVGRKVRKLFPLLHWLNPDIFTDREAFLRKYGDDPKLLRKDISTMMVARLKSDVQPGIPAREHIEEYVSLTERGRKHYDAVLQRPVETFPGGNVPARNLAKLEALKQAAIAPLASEKMTKRKDFSESAKCRRACEIAGEKLTQKEKTVIFTRYLDVAYDLKKTLSKKYPEKVVTVTGRQKENVRQENIERFKEDEGADILIITYGVGGESLNLQAANNIVFVDYPWTYQELVQAMDRVHRIGQKKQVNVYRLIARGTIDEYILKISKESEDIHRLLIRGENVGAQGEEGFMLKVLAEKLGIEKRTLETAQNKFIKSQTTALLKKERQSAEPERKQEIKNSYLKGTNIHASLKGVIVFDTETLDYMARLEGMNPESRKKYSVLSDNEKEIVLSVLNGAGVNALTKEYSWAWTELLRNAMVKLGISDIADLPKAYRVHEDESPKIKRVPRKTKAEILAAKPGSRKLADVEDGDTVYARAKRAAEQRKGTPRNKKQYTPSDIAEKKMELDSLLNRTNGYINGLMGASGKGRIDPIVSRNEYFELNDSLDSMGSDFMDIIESDFGGMLEEYNNIREIQKRLAVAFREYVFPLLSGRDRRGISPASLLGSGFFGSIIASPIIEEYFRAVFFNSHGWAGFAVVSAILIAAHAINIKEYIKHSKRINKDEDVGIFDTLGHVFMAPVVMTIDAAVLTYYFSSSGVWDLLARFIVTHILMNLIIKIINAVQSREVIMEGDIISTGSAAGPVDETPRENPSEAETLPMAEQKALPSPDFELSGGIISGYVKGLDDGNKLARTLLTAVKSYLFSGKKIVITVEEGLGGSDFDAERLMGGLQKWKERLAGRNEKMRTVLDNLIVVPAFRDEADLDSKLKKIPGLDLNDKKDDFVFVFARNAEHKAEAISGIGGSVRAVMINEPEGMTGCYYPLVEVITLSLLKELLDITPETLLRMLAESGIPLEDFNIASISEDRANVAYLIFSLIPRITRYDSNDFGDRYARLLRFIRSA